MGAEKIRALFERVQATSILHRPFRLSTGLFTSFDGKALSVVFPRVILNGKGAVGCRLRSRRQREISDAP